MHCWGADRPPVAGRAGGRRAPAVGGARGARAVRGRAGGVLDRPHDGRRRRPEQSSSTATRGTRTSAATWRSSSTAIPHVATVHSLEPMRPWKREQLGGGYALSGFAERTALEAADAIIAVSAAHLREILECYPAIDPARTSVIYNGIDTAEYRPDPGTDVLERHGIDPARAVGRLRRPDHAPEGAHPSARRGARDRSRRAARPLRRRARHAGDRRARSRRRWSAVRAARGNVIWIEEMLPKPDADPDPQPRDRVRLPVGLRADGDRQPRGDGLRGARSSRPRSAASPRWSRTASPGCSSPTRRGRTEQEPPSTRPALAAALAARVNELLADPARAEAMGLAGRVRAVERFGWDVAAARDAGAVRAAAGGSVRRDPKPSMTDSPRAAERRLSLLLLVVAAGQRVGQHRRPRARRRGCRRRGTTRCLSLVGVSRAGAADGGRGGGGRDAA